MEFFARAYEQLAGSGQFEQKTSTPVIPKPGLSARNLLFLNSGTADSSRDSVALGMTNF
jgi:hypothetical protein